MANRYALQSFFFHNTTSGHDEYCHIGALRDSTSAVVTQYPAMFSTVVPDPVVTGIDPKLYGYLKIHPGGPGE